MVFRLLGCMGKKQSGDDQFAYSIWEGHVVMASRPPNFIAAAGRNTNEEGNENE